MECIICFNRLNNPYAHVRGQEGVEPCMKSFDFDCIESWLSSQIRCPHCNVEVTMDDFKPNRSLAEALEELPGQVLGGVTQESVVRVVKEKSPLAFAPSVEKGSNGFKGTMKKIEKQNLGVYKRHIDRDSTQKIRADWGHQLVAIHKSGKWRFFDLKQGGGAYYEGTDFKQGELASSHRI